MPRSNAVRRAWWTATVAGVIVGAVHTVSPTTVWFLLSLPLVIAWARRGLGPREQRWIFGLLCLASGARVIALAGLFLSANHYTQPFGVLIPDERFMVDRSLWMVYLALGHTLEPVDYLDRFGDYGRSGLQNVLAFWQLWVGPAPYGAHLLSVAMWLAGAIALHRTTRRAFGPLAALGGLAVVLFMPTLFVWSISALKEPLYFFLTGMTMMGAMAVVRGTRARGRLFALLLVVGSIAAIATLRSIALAVTAGGLLLAAAAWLATRRPWTVAAAIVAIGAIGLWGRPPQTIKDRLMDQLRQAALMHIGNVNTPGYGYWLLDPRFYTRPDGTDDVRDSNIVTTMVPGEAGRFAVRAAVSFFAVPLPWRAESRPALALLPQQVAWYGLAALLWVGIVAGWRRDAAFTSVLVANAVLGAAAVSLYNGNVGTFVRMRDSVVPIIVWLSALGGCAVLEWAIHHFSKGPHHAAA